MSIHVRLPFAAVTLLGAILSPTGQASTGASPVRQQGVTYGFLVNGGHLYLPYVYFHWTDHAGKLSGTEETLEPSNSQDGYVVHRHRFTGTRSGDRLHIKSTDKHFLWGAGGRLRFTAGRLYLKESQTGVTWWAAGKPMRPSKWALTAIRFMECYTNPYEAGTANGKCSNHG